ncbi:hypothetical protein KKI24_29390 [bacterium]|nr:hypothetical protein [bacterium]
MDKKQPLENSDVRLSQAKRSNRAEIVSSLKDPAKTDSVKKDFENESPQISEYMKMISRFENKVKQDEIEKKDLERVLQALEDKILSMNTQQKNRLKNIELFKKKGVENLKTMRETLVEMFEDKNERENFFDFLKSPEFVTILLNEQEHPKGYSPATAGSNTQNGKPVKEEPGAAEPQTPQRV